MLFYKLFIVKIVVALVFSLLLIASSQTPLSTLSLSLSHQTCFYVIDIACFLVTTIKFDQVFVLKFGWVLLRYFFLHLILFKYHLFTFKYTYPILFKTQEYLCLAIFEKPMIQVHGKTILSMEFKSIIKAHDSNSWQFIHPKPNSHWQYQKPNSHWQHQNPIFIGNIKT